MTTPVDTPEQARELVREVLATIAPGPALNQLRPHDNLRECLNMDSLDFLAVVARVSERTGLRIEEDDYDQLGDLDGWVALLTERSCGQVRNR